MGLNTYPANPFPPSTDQMDADALEAEVSKLKSGLTNYQTQNDLNLEVPDRKNLLNYDAWKTVQVTSGSAVWENNGVTLTATGDCYTKYNNTDFPIDARIPIKEGETITLSWEANNDLQGNIFIFPNGSTTGAVVVNNDTAKVLSYTATSGVTYVSFRLGVANSGDTISYKNIQIELGSTATAYTPYIPSVESRIEAVENGLTNVLTDISTNTHLNKDSNLDTLPLGWYGINTYEGSGTGTGVPTYNTVGILWHIKGANNSFIQYIFGYNYFACRIRSSTTDAWEAWKFSHNAIPT